MRSVSSFLTTGRRKAALGGATVFCLLASVSSATTSTAVSSTLRFEAEDLKVTTSAHGVVDAKREGADYKVFNAQKAGDSETFVVNVPDKRRYEIRASVVKWNTRGIVQLAIQGKANAAYDGSYVNHGGPLDLYSGTSSLETVSFGEVSFGSSGTKNVRFTVTGKNADSKAYTVGVDALIFVPVGSKPATAPTTVKPSAPPAPPVAGGFAHPGILVTNSDLANVKAKVAAKQEPWYSAYQSLLASGYSNLARPAKPIAAVGCGPSSNPDEGCTIETSDAQAAYSNALIWAYGGDTAHRDKAIQILNAYSSTLKEHKTGGVYTNAPLQAAWAAETFTKAAEVMRYTNSGWQAADIARFETMLHAAFLPLVINGAGSFNWQMSAAEATMNIGVFTNNESVYNKGLANWRKNVVSLVYMPSDGARPIVPAERIQSDSYANAYWYHPTQYVSGLEAETCRDLGHMAMGFAATFNAAQTAFIQGTDLFGEQKARLVAGIEYNTTFVKNQSASGWACPNPPSMTTVAHWKTWEIAYNHYHNVDGISLPNTKALLQSNRTSGSDSYLHQNWESLTNSAGVL